MSTDRKLKGLALDLIPEYFDADEFNEIDQNIIKDLFLEARPRLSQKKGTVIIFGTGGQLSNDIPPNGALYFLICLLGALSIIAVLLC